MKLLITQFYSVALHIYNSCHNEVGIPGVTVLTSPLALRFKWLMPLMQTLYTTCFMQIQMQIPV